MKKFEDKCLWYPSRTLKDVLRTNIEIGSNGGFDMGLNRIPPRSDEGCPAMRNREVNHWGTTRGKDQSDSRLLQSGHTTLSACRSDTIRGRRNNDKYDR